MIIKRSGVLLIRSVLLALLAGLLPVSAAPPTPFNLLRPGEPEFDGPAFSRTNFVFDWEDSFDPDGGPITLICSYSPIASSLRPVPSWPIRKRD